MKTLNDFIKSGSEKEVGNREILAPSTVKERKLSSEKPETKDKVYDPIFGRDENDQDIIIWKSI